MTNEQSDTDSPDFEAVVAALLKVDPEGISGKRKQKDDAGNEEGPAN